MAFPTIPTAGAGRLLSNVQANTTATRTFPALSGLTKNAGDLLIAICIAYQTGTGTDAAFSGWSDGFSEIHDSATSTTMAIGIAYKYSTGSETAAPTVTQAGTVTGHAGMFLLSISGAHPSIVPEAGSRASGTTTASDPASFNPGNWGTQDTLWIAVGGSGETGTGGAYDGIGAAPTNYTNYAQTGISADAVGGVEGAVAFRQLNAASEDIGPFATIDVTNARSASVTIAVPPPIYANTVNAWRVRNDDGSESAATWKAAEDTNPSEIDTDTNFRIRYRAGDTGGAAGTWTLPQLQYNLNESTWNSVTSSSSVVRASASTHFSDGAATTGQLTGGSGGSFVAGTMDEVDGQCDNISLGALGNSEVEFCVQIRSADVNDADEIEFRVLDNGVAIPVHAGGPTVVANEPAVFTFATSSWRIRNDDGSESAATWIAAEDTNATVLAGRPFRVRFRGGDTGGASGTWTTPQLQYNRNSAGWNNVTDSSSIVRSIASSNFTDNAATTTQLTGGSGGTFVAGTMDEVNGAVASISLGASGNSEVEFSVEIRTADITDNDTIELRVLNNGSSVTETTGHPSITANIPGDTLAVSLTENMLADEIIWSDYESGETEGGEPINVSDSLNVSLTESMSIEVQVAPTDTLSVGITDTMSIEVQVAPSDTISVGITDTLTNEVQFAMSDTLAVGITDAVTLEIFENINASDTLSVGITDTITIETQTSQADDLAVGITDTMSLEKQIALTDTLSTNVTDTMSIESQSALTDTLAVSLTEDFDISETESPINVSDSISVGITDSISIAVSISASDTLGVGLGQQYNAAVREFELTTEDFITLDHTGDWQDIDGTESVTLAFLWKPETTHAGWLLFANNAGPRVNPFSDGFLWLSMGGEFTQCQTYTAGEWQLAMMTMPAGAGATQVRAHTYDYGAETWSHANEGTINRTAGTASTFLNIGSQAGFEYLDGRIAAIAVWVGTMPWDTDSDGDATIEAAGLESNLQSWINNAPTHLWILNQSSTSDPVLDSFGDADQTAIDGTTVDTSDLPPEFGFGQDEQIEVDISLSRTDDLSVGITDTITVENSLALTDSVSVGITDSITLEKQIALTDTLSVGITDTFATTVELATATDTLAVSLTEDMDLEISGAEDKNASDSISVGITDSLSLDQQENINASDSLGVAFGQNYNAAVRDFDGTDDVIRVAHGPASGLDGTEQVTMAYLWRAETIQNSGLLWIPSATATVFGTNPFGGNVWFSAGEAFAQGPAYPEDEWLLTMFTKPSGTGVVRSHTYNFTTDSWSHANHGSHTSNAQTTPTVIQMGRWANSAEYLDGQIAAVGLWFDTMPWDVDADGDSTIEAAGLHTSLQAWIDNAPDFLWIFNQANTADDVIEYFGTGADETTLTGTSVLTTGLPDGFSYENEGGETISIETQTSINDSLTLSLSESMLISNPVAASDTLSVGLTDTISIQIQINRTDTLNVLLTESMSIAAATAASDTLAVSLTDNISVEIFTTEDKNMSDTLLVSLVEAMEAEPLISRLRRWDGAAFVTGGTLQRWTGTEFISGGILKIPAPAFPIVSSDNLAVGVTDVMNVAIGGVNSSDTISVGITESISIQVSVSRSDTLSVGLTEVVDVDTGEGGGAPLAPPEGARFSTGEDLALLEGPTSAPPGSVTVDPDTDDLSDMTDAEDPGTTFYLLEGVHTLDASQFAQVIPKNGNTYIGAPGAVLDGKNINQYAFTQGASDVTIQYLEVRNFVCPFDEFVVNHNAGDDWTIEFCNIHHNGGAGIGLGSGITISHCWLHHNRQYGFSAFKDAVNDGLDPAIVNVSIDHCEVHENGDPRDEFEPDGDLTFRGRNGGCKFWDADGINFTDSWIHHSYLVGIWADTNNIHMNVQGNLIEDNWGEGFFYEISYNFAVVNNTFRRNCIRKGLWRNYNGAGDPFPTPALYISESGSEAAVGGLYATSSEVTGNNFINNWDDITLWENADRFCNSPANTSFKIYKPLGAGANLAVCNNPDSRNITVTLTNGSPNFTVTTGTLESTDEGQFVNGTGITVGTKIKEPTTANGFQGGVLTPTTGVLTANATASGSITMTIEAGSIDGEPAYTECRWHTQNVDIHDNVFHHNASEVLGPNSLQGTVVTGKHAVLSQYGTFPSWSPYQADTIQEAITFDQNNVWQDNEYEGDYLFMPFDTNDTKTFSEWQAGPYTQDSGSSFSGTPPTGGGGGENYKPDAPTNIVAVEGNTQARVDFDPPDDFGNDFVVGYTVTSSPGGITATALTGPVTVSGLTNGVAYTFTVKARTTLGQSVASSASNSVTPNSGASLPADTIPWHPIHVSAYSKTPTSAEVSFLVPSSDGGDTITEYVATSSPGGLTGSASSSPVTVSGLTADTEYTFTVTAENSIGVGPASPPTTPITT